MKSLSSTLDVSLLFLIIHGFVQTRFINREGIDFSDAQDMQAIQVALDHSSCQLVCLSLLFVWLLFHLYQGMGFSRKFPRNSGISDKVTIYCFTSLSIKIAWKASQSDSARAGKIVFLPSLCIYLFDKHSKLDMSQILVGKMPCLWCILFCSYLLDITLSLLLDIPNFKVLETSLCIFPRTLVGIQLKYITLALKVKLPRYFITWTDFMLVLEL